MNGLLKVIVVLCSTSSPTTCERERTMEFIIAENLTPYQCVMRAQAFVAEQVGEKLGKEWRVGRYSCKPERGSEREA
jgi:hypothetical protein